MKKINKLPVTLVMCVYNEEDIIENALRSVADYVSEIIVIHDGPCSDKTGKIVKKYGGEFVETKKNKGASEFIRIKSYKLASQKYILQLDADEALSVELQNTMRDGVVSDVDFITVNWLHYRYGKEIKTLIKRPFLFKKEKVYFIECPHEAVRPKKGSTTLHYNTNLFNDAEDRYKNQKEIDREQLEKQAKWISPHARTLINFDKIERFNTNINDKGSLFNEMLSSKNYILHGYITIPLILFTSTLATSIKRRVSPLLLFSELPISLRYYGDLTREIRAQKNEKNISNSTNI